MQLTAIGVNEIHDAAWQVDRKNHFGTWLLLLLKTRARFCFDGEWREVPETTAILYAPVSVQQYRASGPVYIDDWMHIDAQPREIERFGIRPNTPLAIQDAERTYTMFRLIKEEYACSGSTSTTVVSTLLEALLFKLAGMAEQRSSQGTDLLVLRRKIRQFPMNDWILADAARSVALSTSRFQDLYRKEFGVPFGADVIRHRLDYARDLLATSDLSIKQISTRSGYESESWFARQFRQHEGMSPQDWRSAHRGSLKQGHGLPRPDSPFEESSC